MANTPSQQSTFILLSLLIFKLTKCKVTLSHRGSQFHWSKWKQILITERAIREDRDTYYLGTKTFTKEQVQLIWQSILKRSTQYAVFSPLKAWKCLNNEGLIRFLFRVFCLITPIRGGVKSLTRPTSQCRRTESIVSLKRGVCSCAELQVFSCYRGWKEACQAARAISTTLRRELSIF